MTAEKHGEGGQSEMGRKLGDELNGTEDHSEQLENAEFSIEGERVEPLGNVVHTESFMEVSAEDESVYSHENGSGPIPVMVEGDSGEGPSEDHHPLPLQKKNWLDKLRGYRPEYTSIRMKVGGAFTAVLVVVLILGLVGIVRLTSLSSEVNTLANYDMVVVNNSNQLLQDMQNMENGMRGYLITGNDATLNVTYTPAKNAYPQDIQKLQKLLADNPSSKKLLDTAVPAMNKWVTYSQQVIHLRDIGEGPVANNMEASGQGEDLQKVVRDNLTSLITEKQQQATDVAKSLTSAVSSTRLITIILSLLAVLVAVVFGTQAAISTPRNLRKVIAILDDIASAGGDLRRRITGVNSRDEVQELAKSTNRLLETVGDVVKRVVGTSESVAASAQELTASTDETARAVSGIAETASEFAGISDRAMQSLEEMNETLQLVKAQGDTVSQHVNNVVVAVQQVVSSTMRGSEYVTQAQDTMLQAQQISQQANEQIQLLATSSQRIAKITTTIRGIADQTNLLALNAAIEAARAGDAGLGFAVVAQEVRKLAEQSRNATKEIEVIVKENQKLTQEASNSMNAGVQAVSIGSQVTGETSRAFSEIHSSVEQVEPLTQAILTSVTEQGELAKRTTSAIHSLTGYMEQVSAGSEENAASTEESLATVEEIAASAHALATLAQELQETVGKFKL